MIAGLVVDGFTIGVLAFFVVMFGAAFWMASAGWDFVRLYQTRVLGEDPRDVARSHWWLVSPGSLAATWRDPRIVWSPSPDPEVERARRAMLRRYLLAVVLMLLAMSIPFILEAITGSAPQLSRSSFGSAPRCRSASVLVLAAVLIWLLVTGRLMGQSAA